MTIYVDEPLYPFHGQMYCHMFSDVSTYELHAFALSIGVKRCWFHNPKPGDHPHYDLWPSKRSQALASGAQFMSGKGWVRDIVHRQHFVTINPQMNLLDTKTRLDNIDAG